MPSDEDLALARRLVHEIGLQAAGTKDEERTFNGEMAHAAESLLSDGATAEHRARARELLDRIPSA
jgi:hypothetical protein